MEVIIGSYSNPAKHEVALENPTFGDICKITAFKFSEFASVHKGGYELILTIDGKKYNWSHILETFEEGGLIHSFDFYEVYQDENINEAILQYKEILKSYK